MSKFKKYIDIALFFYIISIPTLSDRQNKLIKTSLQIESNCFEISSTNERSGAIFVQFEKGSDFVQFVKIHIYIYIYIYMYIYRYI